MRVLYNGQIITKGAVITSSLGEAFVFSHVVEPASTSGRIVTKDGIGRFISLFPGLSVEVPDIDNLDCMEEGELIEVVKDHSKAPLIRAYAANMVAANAYRLAGMLVDALTAEGAAARIYDRLPPDLKW